MDVAAPPASVADGGHEAAGVSACGTVSARCRTLRGSLLGGHHGGWMDRTPRKARSAGMRNSVRRCAGSLAAFAACVAVAGALPRAAAAASGGGGSTTSSDPFTVSLAVLCVSSLLVTLGVLFEKATHHLMAATTPSTRPIADSLFAELTLLGVIGLFFFVIEQSGVLTLLSRATLGEDHPYELAHMFHEVHLALFFVMVVFLACILLLMRSAQRIVGRWRAQELLCSSLTALEADFNKARDDPMAAQRIMWPCRLCSRQGRAWHAAERRRHNAVYAALRERFIMPPHNLVAAMQARLERARAVARDSAMGVAPDGKPFYHLVAGGPARAYRRKGAVLAFKSNDPALLQDADGATTEGGRGDWLVATTDIDESDPSSAREGKGRAGRRGSGARRGSHTSATGGFGTTAPDGTHVGARMHLKMMKHADFVRAYQIVEGAVHEYRSIDTVFAIKMHKRFYARLTPLASATAPAAVPAASPAAHSPGRGGGSVLSNLGRTLSSKGFNFGSMASPTRESKRAEVSPGSASSASPAVRGDGVDAVGAAVEAAAAATAAEAARAPPAKKGAAGWFLVQAKDGSQQALTEAEFLALYEAVPESGPGGVAVGGVDVEERDTSNDLESDFDFAQYLAYLLGHMIAEMVDVNGPTWVTLELVLILFYALFMALDPQQFAYVSVGMGYSLLLFQWVLHRKFTNIRHALTPASLLRRNFHAHLPGAASRARQGTLTVAWLSLLSLFGKVGPTADGPSGGGSQRLSTSPAGTPAGRAAALRAAHGAAPSMAWSPSGSGKDTKGEAGGGATQEVGSKGDTPRQRNRPAALDLDAGGGTSHPGADADVELLDSPSPMGAGARPSAAGTFSVPDTPATAVTMADVKSTVESPAARTARVTPSSHGGGGVDAERTPTGPEAAAAAEALASGHAAAVGSGAPHQGSALSVVSNSSWGTVRVPATHGCPRLRDLPAMVQDGSLGAPEYENREIAMPTGCSRALFGSLPPSKQEALFWGGRHGIELALHAIRMCLLLIALYVGAAGRTIFTEICSAEDAWVCAVMYVLLAVPLVSTILLLPVVIGEFLIVSNIEELKHRNAVSEVVRAQKTQRTMRALRMLSALKMHVRKEIAAPGGNDPEGSPTTSVTRVAVGAALGGASSAGTDTPASPAAGASASSKSPYGSSSVHKPSSSRFGFGSTKTSVMGGRKKRRSKARRGAAAAGPPPLEGAAHRVYGAESSAAYQRRKAELMEIFRLFDKQGHGKVGTDDMADILAMLGMADKTSEQAALIVAEVDADGSGEVEFEEFFDWMALQEEASSIDGAELSRMVFDLIDADGSGEISVEELRTTLASLGQVMSAEDVLKIVHEADADGGGTLGFEEFHAMMQRQMEASEFAM